ncbi:hypothetical protein QJS10_CPA03g00307 [Acorus calamus]|uniref:Secreted protein n=1 Tax=Acorus calamus TaxID=4465 RepID=A0AAV9F3S1_ACOCL|nr:hypothetical protein QJS10_CPA03g00307 [Acorus calamus]
MFNKYLASEAASSLIVSYISLYSSCSSATSGQSLEWPYRKIKLVSSLQGEIPQLSDGYFVYRKQI